MPEFTRDASVHYPPALEEVVGYFEVRDKPGQTGGALLVFRDEHGSQVTLRLLRTAVRSLSQKLQAGPTPEPE